MVRLLRRLPLPALLTGALLAASLGALGPAQATAAPTAPAAAAARADTAPLRIGTYNIRAGVKQAKFEKVVAKLKPYADVIGLQEIGATDRGTHLAGDSAWGYYRPEELGQNPIIWDRSMFDFVGSEGVVIAKKRDLHGEHSGDDDKGDTWATVVRLVQRSTGQQITFVNVHLVRGAVKGGLPAPGKPHLFKLFTDQVKGTLDLIRQERSVSDQVFVLGDFNVGFEADLKRKHKKLPFKRYKKVGLRSMWQGSPLLKKRYGTKNDALIDQVWHTSNPRKEQILRKIKGSDHRPAVATYDLSVDPTYVPVTGTIGWHPADLEQSARERHGGTRDPDLVFRLTGDLAHGAAMIVAGGTADRSDKYNQGDYLVDYSELYDEDLDSARIKIDFQGDNDREPDETFTLTLVPLGLSTVVLDGRGVARGTIENDD